MRKYILIAFRTNDDKPMFSYMLDSITEITESKFLKFKEVGNTIIIHFGSSRNFEELKKYVNIVLSKCSDINFLFENNDNMSVNMCFEDLGTFLSLDENVPSPKIDKTETREYDNISNEFMLSFINSISLSQILHFLKFFIFFLYLVLTFFIVKSFSIFYISN